MIWQDWAIAAIQVAFLFALIPAINFPEKPARSTCALTAGLLFAMSGIFVTLDLWFGAVTSAAVGAGWMVLLFQKRM